MSPTTRNQGNPQSSTADGAKDMSDLSQDFASVLRDMGQQRRLPEFFGRPQEDPQRFIERFRDVAQKRKIHTEDWTAVAATQLQGIAADWWAQYAHIDISFTDFEAEITERFGNQELLAQLTAELYSESQPRSEAAAVFVHRKLQLFKRLQPDVPETTMVNVIKAQLRADMRPFLVTANITKLSDLTAIVASLERSLPATRTRFISPSAKPAFSLKTPPRSISPAPRPRPWTFDDGDAPRRDDYRTRPESRDDTDRSGPKCWHCPEYHFHRSCPVLREQGNAERAEERRGFQPP